MIPRTWYHCSNTYHGPRFAADRRRPILLSENEPLTPRLCVAPSIAECLAARLFVEGQPIHVYRTQQPRRAVNPAGVWDKAITGERWLVPPATLEWVETLPASLADECFAAIRLYHAETGRSSSVRLRCAQLLRVVAVFRRRGRRVPPSLCRFAERLRRGFELGADPEAYILAAAESALAAPPTRPIH